VTNQTPPAMRAGMIALLAMTSGITPEAAAAAYEAMSRKDRHALYMRWRRGQRTRPRAPYRPDPERVAASAARRAAAEEGTAGRYVCCQHTAAEGGRYYFVGPFPDAGAAARWARKHGGDVEEPGIRPEPDEEVIAP